MFQDWPQHVDRELLLVLVSAKPLCVAEWVELLLLVLVLVQRKLDALCLLSQI